MHAPPPRHVDTAPSKGRGEWGFSPSRMGGGVDWPFGHMSATFLKYFNATNAPKGAANAPLAPHPPPYIRPCQKHKHD